jgi:hypothetical protein
VAAETGRGLFSRFLGGALEGGAADVLGRVTVAGLYAYLDECFGAWDQRPAFKANVDRLHELRRCTPAVPPSELRKICKLFPVADHHFRLDPSYEPDAEPRDPEHERVHDAPEVSSGQAGRARRRGAHVLRGDGKQGMPAHAPRQALLARRRDGRL